MSESTPLYNSRITKVYIQYLSKFYPDIDLEAVLNEAGIARYEIEDPAHWFTQEQQDRLHDILVARTGNPHIARESGRYSTTSAGLGATKQYALGLMSPATIYLLIEKIHALMSRGANVSAKKIGTNQVEITAVPKAGVHEKPYQCENRSGTFESIARMFTDKFAHIDHPSCVHKGDESCRYIISWTKAAKENVSNELESPGLATKSIVCPASIRFDVSLNVSSEFWQCSLISESLPIQMLI